MHTLRAQAVLAFLCFAMLLSACGPKRVAANVPSSGAPVDSAYVRLTTMNAVVAEANKTAVEAVKSAERMGLISKPLTREIFVWQEKIAATNKALSVALSDSSVDVKSAEVAKVVLDLAAPPMFDRWMTGLTSDEQRLVVASLRSLSAVITMIVKEFGRGEPPRATLRQRPPTRANLDAYLAASDARRVMGIESRTNDILDLGALWWRQVGSSGGAL